MLLEYGVAFDRSEKDETKDVYTDRNRRFILLCLYSPLPHPGIFGEVPLFEVRCVRSDILACVFVSKVSSWIIMGDRCRIWGNRRASLELLTRFGRVPEAPDASFVEDGCFSWSPISLRRRKDGGLGRWPGIEMDAGDKGDRE